MNIDQADPAELAALRAAFDVDDGEESALGWEAVHAFEADGAGSTICSADGNETAPGTGSSPDFSPRPTRRAGSRGT